LFLHIILTSFFQTAHKTGIHIPDAYLDKCCKAIAETYKFKLATTRNPPSDETELDRVRSIRLPLTIEHPAFSDKEMYNCLGEMLGGLENLMDTKMWGYGPSSQQSELESPESSAGEKSEEEIGSDVDMDDAEDSDVHEVARPKTPPASQPPRNTQGDKRPPSSSQMAATPKKKHKGIFSGKDDADHRGYCWKSRKEYKVEPSG
jgi:hypothetical protein